MNGCSYKILMNNFTFSHVSVKMQVSSQPVFMSLLVRHIASSRLGSWLTQECAQCPDNLDHNSIHLEHLRQPTVNFSTDNSPHLLEMLSHIIFPFHMCSFYCYFGQEATKWMLEMYIAVWLLQFLFYFYKDFVFEYRFCLL
jgi:hypothetical protein